MAGRVYSYLRFSDPRQAAGHSLERQAAYAARWAAEHSLQLDESLTLRDEGLSAYHQRHVKSGALGVFLAAVQGGQVPDGSVLVVEALDRLSRAEPIQAQAQLAQIINAGITVVTASDGKTYSRAQLKANPMDLVYSLLLMIRAHEESDTKSKRVTAAIVKQCRAWQAGTWRGPIRNGKDPHWVQLADGAWQLVPARAAALRECLRLYLGGHGGQDVMRRLASAGLQVTDGEMKASHLYKLIKNPALMGTKRLTVAGETFDLAGYYPALLTADEFSELQAAGGHRGRRGSRTDVPHVLTGLGITYCGYCGRAMSGQNLFGKIRSPGQKLQPGYRRLLCAGLQYGTGRCQYPKSRSVAPLERALMGYCSDIINLRGLYGGDAAQPLRAELAQLRTQLATTEAQLARLLDAMLAVDAADTPAAFARKARELEADQARLQAAVQQVEQQLGALARHDIEGTDARWRALAAGVLDLDTEARLQARQLVADTFSRIVVYASGLRPETDPPDVIDVVLVARGGRSRLLRIDAQGGWVAGDEALPSAVTAAAEPAATAKPAAQAPRSPPGA